MTDSQKRREILSRRPSYRSLFFFVLVLNGPTGTGFPVDPASGADRGPGPAVGWPWNTCGSTADSCFDSVNRKILNDLSSDAPAVPRIEEEKAEEDSAAAAAPAITTVTVPTPIYQTSSGQYSRWPVWGCLSSHLHPFKCPFAFVGSPKL